MIQALYLHIPFCHTICSYCDFPKMVASQSLMDDYVNALVAEMKQVSFDLRHLSTLYIGGGTPSHLSLAQTKKLLEALKQTINLSQIREFTIEANPNDITPELVNLWLGFGVNRVSLGVQTTNETFLTTLNRTHSTIEATRAIKTLRSGGIDRISCDFIFGLPNQTKADVARDLAWIALQEIDHLSYYQLILEERTKLYYDVMQKKVLLPDEDHIIEMMDLIDEVLPRIGFVQYEISNYAKPGKESLHNQVYWNTQEYLGLGMGAHSQVGETRFHNHKTIKAYIEAVRMTQSGMDCVDDCNLVMESIFLGLRLNQGIHQDQWQKRFQIDLFEKYPKLAYYIKQGLLVKQAGYLKTTPRGRRLLNQIESVLMES